MADLLVSWGTPLLNGPQVSCGAPRKDSIPPADSVPRRRPELRDVRVHNLPVSVALLQHEREDGRPVRDDVLRDVGRGRRREDGGRITVEAGDCDGPVAIKPDQPITILREGLD